MRGRYSCLFFGFVLSVAFTATSAHAADREVKGKPAGPQNTLMLWYPQPGIKWTDGIAVGNGRLGAMVFGGVEKDRLQLNEITVWSGGPSPNADRPEAYKALPEIRAALKDGNYAEANKLVGRNMTGQGEYFPSYQTLGDLNFNFTYPDGEVTEYNRWLDVKQAVASVEFKLNGVEYTREVFSSASNGVIAMRLTTSKKGGLNFDVGLSRQVSAQTRIEGTDTLIMTGNTDYRNHPGTVGYEVQAKVIAKGGTVAKGNGERLVVAGADEVVILVAAGTTYVLDWSKDYKGADPHDQVSRTYAKAAELSYDTIKQAHIADFQKFFDRVDFSIGQSQAVTLPTDQRLTDFKDGKQDPALAELYYQFGRYLLICSSRPDNPLPSNSQGIWGDGLDMPWKCDYKSNINFQMNYWPAESANLSECHLPMIRLIEGLVEPGRKTARAYFNVPGWVCSYTTNAFGWTSPGGGMPWGPFFGGSGWDCQHLWEHYAFSRDREYLKRVYPVMKEAAEFYLNILVPDENGLLITSPSLSPENKYKTDKGVVAAVVDGSAVEREIIWDLFTNTIQASKILKTDVEFRKQLEDAKAKIRPLEIGKAGQLEEWGHDWDLNAPEKTHRHISHLFALFPGKQITVEETPALADAVRKSLELRTDVGTGWAKAWKINLYARLHDGDHAYKLLCDQLRLATNSRTNYSDGGGTYANMFDAHPPFQIDGNFGGVSGINEMLLQSHLTYTDTATPDEDRYIIELLPALPSAWPTGHITGLRARGGFQVDQKWSDGKLTSASILGLTGGKCKVRYGKKTIDLTIKSGEVVRLDAALEKAAAPAADLSGQRRAESNTPSSAPQSPPAGGPPRRGPGGFGRPIVLGPDDKPAFADPPAGFNVKREDIARGRMEMIQYDSKTVGTRRKMLVYTPPGYSADRKYPVLYLLHGIGGDETEWQRFTAPDVILDNLLADGKLVPMIVVMPNGRAQPNDRAEGDIYRQSSAFENFENDLLKDVIPAIEARYSVQADREHRALAGLSMGGGQSLNFGLGHLDTFAWVGAFSPAPNTKPPAQLVPDPAAATQKLKLLWLSCGNRDGLISISQGVHNYLKEKNVPHIWHVDSNAHDSPEWRNNLYLFSQRIFRSVLTDTVVGVGFDTQPEGPILEAVQISGSGATVTPVPDKDAFLVKFPAGSGKPAAIFSLKETNINDRLGLALDIENIGPETARVYADLNGDNWVRGYVTVPPGKTSTLFVFQRRKKLSDSDTELFPGMHGIPGGKMSLWAGIDEPVVAKELKVFVVMPKQETSLKVGKIRPFGSSKLPDMANFYPFIDKYGQYKYKEWPGKVRADSDFKAAMQQEDADLAAHPGPNDFNQYGGWATGPQLKTTGHFRVEKYQGKWWFVDPEGRLFWSNGLDCVGFNQSSTRIQGREKFFADPAPMGNFLNRNLETKYGDDWRNIAGDRLLQRMRSWGLNTLGGGANREIMQKKKAPYTIQLSSGVTRGGGNPNSDTFPQNVRRSLTAAAATCKDDPWCIGFFVDNEIHASTDPAWFESYYSKVSAVAKEVMPDTLYLGSRLDYHDWPDVPEARHDIVRLAAKYCDVVSFNFYKFTLDDVVMPEGIDKPLIIGEFHMGALDRGKFHTGLRVVIDQNQRAEAYRYYVTSALKNPAIVGAHWFQCYDESTTGRFDGENYQIGFLDICDTPYFETIAAVREIGYNLYSIRMGKQ